MKTIQLITLITLLGSLVSIPASEIEITQTVEIQIQLGAELLLPIRIGLFGNNAPKAVENFFKLCTDPSLFVNGNKVSYIQTSLHRIVYRNVLQGGLISSAASGASVSKSIWGGYFSNEDLSIEPAQGVIGYDGKRVGNNGSEFFIPLTNEVEHIGLDFQIFGRITLNENVLSQIEFEAGSPQGVPIQSVRIIDCKAV